MIRHRDMGTAEILQRALAIINHPAVTPAQLRYAATLCTLASYRCDGRALLYQNDPNREFSATIEAMTCTYEDSADRLQAAARSAI